MEIRDYRNSDADEIADLFHGSVHALASEGYTSHELEAWAPTPPDYSHWRCRLEAKQPYVACRDGMIVGFIELEDDGHIDCFYTHGDFQRQGVGRALYAHMLREARRRGIRDFHVEASAIARTFGTIGVTRASLGVQDFTPKVQAAISKPGRTLSR